MHASPTSPDPNLLPRLWATARVLLGEMTVLFGAPAALTALACLNTTLRRALSPWVRSLEELVRKLLLAEAATQMPSAPPSPWRPPITARPAFLARTHSSPNIAASTRPHARFNLALPRDERVVPDNRAPRIRPLWDEPAAPRIAPVKSAARPKRAHANRLALRFVALQRVIEEPESYVRRLAARLARIARDQRARAALRFACRGPDRIAPGFGDPLRDANTLMFARVPALGDTS